MDDHPHCPKHRDCQHDVCLLLFLLERQQSIGPPEMGSLWKCRCHYNRSLYSLSFTPKKKHYHEDENSLDSPPSQSNCLGYYHSIASPDSFRRASNLGCQLNNCCDNDVSCSFRALWELSFK